MLLETALAWAINAKNSLQMWSGFLSYQLVYGQQQKLPSFVTDELPALHGTSNSKNVVQHINTMHESRKIFIEAESAERARRALRQKLRSSSINIEQDDRIFYKRQDSGVVIGRDGKVIFVQHESIYVWVSMNRIIKAGEEFDTQVEENIMNSSVF